MPSWSHVGHLSRPKTAQEASKTVPKRCKIARTPPRAAQPARCTKWALLTHQVLTRVVGQYPKSNVLLIDCGWTGASAQGKDAGFGGIDGHPELRIVTFKQECGEVTSAHGGPLDFDRYPIGSILAIIPYHSCASTHQHATVHVLADDGETITDSWSICKGW